MNPIILFFTSESFFRSWLRPCQETAAALAAALAQQAALNAAAAANHVPSTEAVSGDPESEMSRGAGKDDKCSGKKNKTLSKAELAKLLLSGGGDGSDDDDVCERGGLAGGGGPAFDDVLGKPKEKVKRLRMQNQKGTTQMYIKP
jgi:hypothetical protein